MTSTTTSPKRPALVFLLACLFSLLLLTSCEETAPEARLPEQVSAAHATKGHMLPHQELAQLRRAVARYHRIENALADGYDFDLTGYRTQMGHHYLKMDLLDDQFELTKPELLMYVQDPNGRWRFVGVEYAVPITDMENPQPAPEGFSGSADVWGINTEFNVWVLHVWVGLNNPQGIFASHNPRLP
jgi:hypothetical protein